MRAVGLSGWSKAGKDTVAEIMVRYHGFNQIAFADALRDFLYVQDPLVRMDGQEEYWRLSLVIDKYGWQGYKNSPFDGNLRTLIQRTGTEAGRGKIHENVWVDVTSRNAAAYDKVVFFDVRFRNEAEAVKSFGGEIWRIDRPGIEPANNHASEMEMNDYPFDLRLQNDSTLEELMNQVEYFLG